MRKVIISVIGSGLSIGKSGKTTKYKILDDNRKYKSKCELSVIPILNVEEGEKTLLFIAPHSLEYKKQTKKFVESITKKLLKCNSNKAGFNYKFIKENNNLKLRIGEKTCNVYIQPVQVRGKIGSRIFNGDPRTAFTATYYALTQIGGDEGIDEIIIDTTHGWNHILLLTALGAQAYAKIKHAKLRYYTTEPAASAGGGRTASSRELNIFEIEGISTILKLIDTISNFQSSSIRGFTLEDQEELIKLLKEDIQEKDADKAKQLPEIIVEFRRLLCGLSTAMIPYIHMKLLSLKDKKVTINNYLKQLGEKIGEIVDSEGDTKITYNVNSSLLSYIVLHSINYTLDELVDRIGERNFDSSEELTENFIKGLHKYYNKKWPLMAGVMEYELGSILSSGGGGVASRVLKGGYGYVDYTNGKYIYFNEDKQKIEFDLKSIQCDNISKNIIKELRKNKIKKSILENACISYKIFTKLKKLEELKKKKNIGENEKKEIISSINKLIPLIRNLYAHLGIQHFTIADPSNMKYSKEFFEVLEKSLNDNGSICDIAQYNEQP